MCLGFIITTQITLGDLFHALNPPPPPSGAFYVAYRGQMWFILCDNANMSHSSNEHLKSMAKSAYDDYMNDQYSWETHGCPYDVYISCIIDKLCQHQCNLMQDNASDNSKVDSLYHLNSDVDTNITLTNNLHQEQGTVPP